MLTSSANPEAVAAGIARCAAAIENLPELRTEVHLLREQPGDTALFAAALFDLERARRGDAEARTQLLEVADSLLVFWRERTGDSLADTHPVLGPLWASASALLVSFEVKRFKRALDGCWEARADAALLQVAIAALQPAGNRRVEFAACLYHLELARLFVDSSRAEFARRAGLVHEAYQSKEVATELVGDDPGLQHLWKDLIPYLDEFFDALEDEAERKRRSDVVTHPGGGAAVRAPIPPPPDITPAGGLPSAEPEARPSPTAPDLTPVGGTEPIARRQPPTAEVTPVGGVERVSPAAATDVTLMQPVHAPAPDITPVHGLPAVSPVAPSEATVMMPLPPELREAATVVAELPPQLREGGARSEATVVADVPPQLRAAEARSEDTVVATVPPELRAPETEVQPRTRPPLPVQDSTDPAGLPLGAPEDKPKPSGVFELWLNEPARQGSPPPAAPIQTEAANFELATTRPYPALKAAAPPPPPRSATPAYPIPAAAAPFTPSDTTMMVPRPPPPPALTPSPDSLPALLDVTEPGVRVVRPPPPRPGDESGILELAEVVEESGRPTSDPEVVDLADVEFVKPPPAPGNDSGILELAEVLEEPILPKRPLRPSLDVEVGDYEPDEAAQTFWRHTEVALGLLPAPDQPRLDRRALSADGRAERKKMNAWLDDVTKRFDTVPEARTFACLIRLYLAGQLKEKSLFGGVNAKRKEAFAAAFQLLSAEPLAAGHCAVWFELDGKETVEHLNNALEVLGDYLQFCARQNLDPLDPLVPAQFLG